VWIVLDSKKQCLLQLDDVCLGMLLPFTVPQEAAARAVVLCEQQTQW
jgi:hypothetical protein